MAAGAGGDELASVRNYFDNEGFQRWNRIYGTETEGVNGVQLDIRRGHATTVGTVLSWLDASPRANHNKASALTVCDVGCGTGSLTIPLALQGAVVCASDISASMVNETRDRYRKATDAKMSAGGHNTSSTLTLQEPTFSVAGLEDTTGEFDVVMCIDVLIHYPNEKVDEMIQHLASMAKDTMLISFAPKTLQYSILKRIGELFPGKSKATRAYLHAEADVERALAKAGFRVERRHFTATSFYFSQLYECKRILANNGNGTTPATRRRRN